jgi:hypothetical protein
MGGGRAGFVKKKLMQIASTVSRFKLSFRLSVDIYIFFMWLSPLFDRVGARKSLVMWITSTVFKILTGTFNPFHHIYAFYYMCDQCRSTSVRSDQDQGLRS